VAKQQTKKLPDRKAKFWPPTWRRFLITLFVLLFFLIGGAIILPRLWFQPTFTTPIQLSAVEILQQVNQLRQQAGLQPLSVDVTLEQAAAAKAQDMLQKQYWAHVAPDGQQPWSFFKQFGYNYSYAGENLARDFSHEADLIQAWLDSPSHRDNIYNPNYSHTGIAIAKGQLKGFPTVLIVQFFAAPKAVYLIADNEQESLPLPKTAALNKEVDLPSGVINQTDQAVFSFGQWWQRLTELLK